MKRQQIEAAILPDRLIMRKSGEIVARWSYFYRHGRNEEQYQKLVEKAVPGSVVVSARDAWNPWPRDSFFEVVFTVNPNPSL